MRPLYREADGAHGRAVEHRVNVIVRELRDLSAQPSLLNVLPVVEVDCRTAFHAELSDYHPRGNSVGRRGDGHHQDRVHRALDAPKADDQRGPLRVSGNEPLPGNLAAGHLARPEPCSSQLSRPDPRPWACP